MNFAATPLRRLAGAFALAIGLAVAATGPAAAQAKKAAAPVLVTSLGQSLDAFQVQLAVRRAGIMFQYDAHIEPAGFGDAKTLFLAVGASVKGFGEAGISINDELARATHLLDEAKKKGMYVVALHIGGQDRRDALSNQIIDLVAPKVDKLIVVKDSDTDKKFTNIAAAAKIPLVVIDDVTQLTQPIKDIFAGS